MNNSSKKIMRENNFPRFFGFPSAISYIRKSTKIRFSRIQPKMVELHKSRKSSKMIVYGWYMTHFDRRDILKSKKLGLGWFWNFFDFPGPIYEFSRFFRKFLQISNVLKTRFLLLSTTKF